MSDDLKNTTIIVKTFERAELLDRLLVSIRRFYPDVPVLVADDSEQPTDHRLATRTFRLPFDSGLPVGRNLLLRHVPTRYFITCDDDFVFRPDTRLERLIDALETHPDLDIVGGHADDGNKPWQMFGDAKPAKRGDLLICDYVRNFFAARTLSVQQIGGWSERTKIGGEHREFFSRAKSNGLGVALLRDVQVGHFRRQTNRELQRRYSRFRHRDDADALTTGRPTTVVVGSGSSTAGRGLGQQIDRHDRIVRINWYRTAGHEDDVGSRTTHWMLCCSPDVLRLKNGPIDCRQMAEVWTMARPRYQADVDQLRNRLQHARTVLHIPHLSHRMYRFARWHEDVKRITVEKYGGAIRPTTGLIAIANALDRWGPPIDVAGFDPSGRYHWGKAGRFENHNLQAEAELIDDWQAAGLVRRLEG